MEPYFSIIVPCYNSRDMIGDLLQSIVNQNMRKDEIEVILADDCSTEPYDDVIEKYTEKLNIIKTKTKYNYCPANTRQAGVDKASGKWLMFADHDDIILPNSLPKVKKRIEDINEEYYLATAFYEIEPFSREITRVIPPDSGWTHGKFINRKNIWEAYNLSYKKDLTSHEDIYINSEIQCVLSALDREPTRAADIVCYVWRAWPKSQSKSIYTGEDGKEHDFLQCFFRDYIASTGDVYLRRYKEGIIDKDFALKTLLEIVGYCYFYCQGFVFREPTTYVKRNEWHAKCFVRKIKKAFKITDSDILRFFYGNGTCEEWRAVREASRIATGEIIEPESFIYWLKKIDKVER